MSPPPLAKTLTPLDETPMTSPNFKDPWKDPISHSHSGRLCAPRIDGGSIWCIMVIPLDLS